MLKMCHEGSKCNVCLHNRQLKRLIADLIDQQHVTREQWKAATSVLVHDNVMPGGDVAIDEAFKWFLQDLRGMPTIIPSYSSYTRLWEKVFIINPMEVDWSNFDIHDSWDVEYLTSVVEISNDQKDLWINDDASTGLRFIADFVATLQALKRLLIFVMNVIPIN